MRARDRLLPMAGGDLELTRSLRLDILLVGTGKRGLFPPPKFKKYINSLGIQVDVLDSVRFLFQR
mgnify:FL=1